MILSNASFNGIPFLFNSINAFDKPVPALPPLTPLLARTPSKADVSSIVLPVAFAAGETFFNASCKLVKSNALELVLLAKTSTTLWVSSASKPKALTVEPANIAAEARSTSIEAAKSNVALVDAKIWSVVKPILANSVCSSPTCIAVNCVVAPSSFAEAERASISSAEALETALSVDICFANSAPFLVAAVNNPANAPAATRNKPIPEEAIAVFKVLKPITILCIGAGKAFKAPPIASIFLVASLETFLVVLPRSLTSFSPCLTEEVLVFISTV